MERLLRHDGESRDTDRLTWSHHRRVSGGQGAHREVNPLWCAPRLRIRRDLATLSAAPTAPYPWLPDSREPG